MQRATKDDINLIKHLLGVLESLQIDYTLFFRTLSNYSGDKKELLKLGLYETPLKEWLLDYDKRSEQESQSQQERQEQMLKTNPKYVLKNYMLQEAIDDAENQDFSKVNTLLKIAKNPYAEHPKEQRWAGKTPEEFKNRKLSCSS